MVSICFHQRRTHFMVPTFSKSAGCLERKGSKQNDLYRHKEGDPAQVDPEHTVACRGRITPRLKKVKAYSNVDHCRMGIRMGRTNTEGWSLHSIFVRSQNGQKLNSSFIYMKVAKPSYCNTKTCNIKWCLYQAGKVYSLYSHHSYSYFLKYTRKECTCAMNCEP